ncbi:DNA polymerase alpha/epsilon subunit B, putative [Angomonas deanei]|uniref:DNA polymerase epsilon subunit n=1 Tax=Angomonas deanei TaxID=59799 RepID=A0A7G2CAI8_9TRYP|nr:DNA polymerase alpha/epsilon subunit B, putative [Angomonas deanei]
MADYRPQIQQLARAHQYRLHPFALKRLSDFLAEARPNEGDGQNLLRDLFTLLQKQTSASTNAQDRFVDLDRINGIISLQVSKMKGVYQHESGPAVQVVSLKEVPRTYIDPNAEEVRVQYPEGSPFFSPSSTLSTSDGPGGQVGAWRQRYRLCRRRCLRSGIYRKEIKSNAAHLGEEFLPLLVTSSLEGIGAQQQVAVLGLLVQRGEGFLLEDLRGQVKIEFELDSDPGRSVADPSVFVGTGFLVVAKGFFENSVFRVRRVELPPVERREAVLADVGPIDLFGLGPQDLTATHTIEKAAVQSVILFLAHVHLDKPRTMQHLQFFFQRMQERSEAELADTTFVLIGNFCSTPLRPAAVSHLPDVFDEADGLRVLFDQLAQCIVTHCPTGATHSHFILIPGPEDGTSLQGFLPQPPLPASVLKNFRSRVRKVSLAPNPARLRFCTHEIVVCRREFLHDLQAADTAFAESVKGATSGSNSAGRPLHSSLENFNPSTSTSASFERVAKTVVDSAHLVPDARGVTKVLWPLDHTLSLPALPHTLLLCDSTEPWECFYKDSHVINPGSFAVSTSFLWYTPSDGECNLSNVE